MKRLRNLVLTLVALAAGMLIVAFALYPSQYVLRLLAWGDADVADYQRFPAYKLQPGQPNFRFVSAPDEARVQALFETDAAVTDLDKFLADNATQAFLVIQHDRILYEKYYNGAQRESVVTSFSEAKSFTSALIGIAMAEGQIRSVDDPITTYLPELADRDPRFADITIKHLLMMASGIKYAEFPFFHGDDAKTYYYPDLRRLALEQTSIAGGPGEEFLYNNYHPLLLGLILERATGKPVPAYLQEKLWSRLGMEFEGSWSLDSEASGFAKMESGINGRAIDFAKFGRLFLNGGVWEGEQIIPAAWVQASTREIKVADRAAYYKDSAFFTELNGYYGYMWWGVPRAGGRNDFLALGNHGQYLYVSPEKDLIIVRHGAEYGVDTWDWVKLFYQVASRIEG
ncbi:MAG: beta-lactamase [Symbiobacteriaceae bacterium]|nr:beta-lactamase [Symbiobacteriaceae bacterium]